MLDQITSSSELLKTRVDHVGSLLRPQKLKDVYARHGRSEISDEELYEAQNVAIREVIALQEVHELPVVTDGEFRRINFQDSFAESVSGVTPRRQSLQFQEQRASGGKPLQRWEPDSTITDPKLQYWRPQIERLGLAVNRPLQEWVFAKSLTKKPVKVTLISPDRIGETFDRQNAASIYADFDEYLSDVISIERRMVQELSEAGCPYIQIDAPSYTKYVDPKSLERIRSSGQDPIANMERSIKADNAIISDLPGVVFGIHLCRGNVRSMWHREGSYDAIAERLFNGLQHQRFLLEYDTERAGGFEPLRFVPKNKVVVLGLVSTKVPTLETADELKRRIEDATRFIALDQLALSPQCGFSSNILGNLLGEDDQWRKLELIRNVAAEVWGI
jgi:5-methyltetrahydropteroyltriglutamate--homocysteine methyltransferase